MPTPGLIFFSTSTSSANPCISATFGVVRPLAALDLALAPLARNSLTMSRWPVEVAPNKAVVLCLLSYAFTSVPFSRRILTISRCPTREAHVNSVTPSLLLAFISAPRFEQFYHAPVTAMHVTLDTGGWLAHADGDLYSAIDGKLRLAHRR